MVDMDLQGFFNRVNQDRLMARLESRCPDADLLRLVNRFLKAGASVIRWAYQRIGLQHSRSHALRHAFACRLVENVSSH